jgi:hypothetical protein
MTIILSDGLFYGVRSQRYLLGVSNGKITFVYDRVSDLGTMLEPYGLIKEDSSDIPGMWWNTVAVGRGRLVEIRVPIWIIAVLIACLMTARAWFEFRSLSKCGACVCGYDLTGNASGICPECGEPVDKEDKEATPLT